MDVIKQYLDSAFFNHKLKQFILNRSEKEVISDELYLKYPELFASAFKSINLHKINLLNIGGYLYYKSVLILDKVLDEQLSVTQFHEHLFLSSKLQEETIKILSSIFELKSPFWELWDNRQQEYITAIQLEKQLFSECSFKKYELVADSKSAFGKVALDAIYILSKEKNKSKYDDFLKSHCYFSIGLQLIDDLNDFEEDYNQKQFNWAYYKTKSLLKKEGYDINNLSLSDIKKLFYIKGIAVLIREKSLRLFKKSKMLVRKYKAHNWEKAIENYEQKIKYAIDNINGHLLMTKTKIEINQLPQQKVIYPVFNCENKNIRKGVNFIIEEWKNNYPDLKHLMYLSKLDGFSGKSNIHVGDVFQRAMITNILCNIQNIIHIDLNKIIKQEINYIITQRLKTNIGGWSYFPTCPEIAADADDLGEIIQVFCNSSNPEMVVKYCKPAINTLFTDRLREDKGIETWVIPKNNLTALEKKQDFFNQTKWGKGPDTEVMANFLYSLTLYDKRQFHEQILNSCNYLLMQQEKEGFWESRWYYGNFYGTYVCLRLFKSMKVSNRYIKIAGKYITSRQNYDGGWGTTGVSDPLNTALAMLCLNLLNIDIPKSAITFLNNKQSDNGSWKGVPFIKPRLNEPYISTTLTTAIVTNALVVTNNY